MTSDKEQTGASGFDLAACRAAAARRSLDAWVDRYLRSGPWANTAMAEGLLAERRWWLGPGYVVRSRLQRCCGPEADMEFPVDPMLWQRRIGALAAGLTSADALPPLIVEWRQGGLSVRDGNHRLAAMASRGWPGCWCVVWCNSVADAASARAALAGFELAPATGAAAAPQSQVRRPAS